MKQGYELLHRGALALAQVEANGIQIDAEYLTRTIKGTEERVSKETRRLMETELWTKWRRRFGSKANITSREQLGLMLFSPKEEGGFGYEYSGPKTKGGRFSTKGNFLETLGLPILKEYLFLQSLEKTLSTNLKGIQRELDENNVLHPVFNLHNVSTYRSSSDTPNFQNFPNRIPEMAKLVRRAFIARPGRVLVENDFKGVEVGVAACYHKDPVMIAYFSDPSKDMHRDMAMQLYCLTMRQWELLEKAKKAKPIRHSAKNKFVFPQFYGDWYLSCSRALWQEIDRTSLQIPDGRSLREHLRGQGIGELGALDPKKKPREGTFEKHVQEVEYDFWNNRFKVYGKWKKSWFQRYLEKGYFDTLTGFRIGGVMRRNEVINYPVQGSAFHCLLWSLIEIVKELRKRKMKTMVVGQVHDSITADVLVEELDEYLAIVEDVTRRRLREFYKWIIVPLSVDYSLVPQGMTWVDKREFKYHEGICSVDGFSGSAKDLITYWS